MIVVEWKLTMFLRQTERRRPHSCVSARPTTAPDAKTWSIPTSTHYDVQRIDTAKNELERIRTNRKRLAVHRPLRFAVAHDSTLHTESLPGAPYYS